MALLVLVRGFNPDGWINRLKALGPDIDIQKWPNVPRPDRVEFVLTWNSPPGELKRFPRLRCIASMGAGVDHILRDPERPPGIPVTRVVSASLARSMSEYVVLTVLTHCRQMARYRQDQAAARWDPAVPLLARDTTVGIMGMGRLGKDAAEKLRHLGFPVIGWRRTPGDVPGVTIYYGNGSLESFLGRCRILVCLLPLTPETRNILNRRNFARLPAGAYLINVARGDHLVEEDLLAALDAGNLSGACLDVFRTEPLPAAHPFWRHPGITVTPHISSMTYPEDVAPQIIENYRRMKSGAPLRHTVDVERGY